MAFCVNCGTSSEMSSFLCVSCHSDPKVPTKTWKALMEKLTDTSSGTNFPDFSVKGEKLSLIVAILLTVGILLTATLLSFGFLFLLLATSLIGLRIGWVSSKAGMMKVSDDTFPEIYRVARLASCRLRIPMPPMFIQQDPTPNAYTSGLFQKNWIVITSGLIELCTPDEILTVIGHELGHIRMRHVTWQVLTQPGVQSAGALPNIFVLLKPLYNNWSLRSEFSADRAGLLASGDIRACINTEVKLMVGKALPDDFDMKKYIDQVMQEEYRMEESLIELYLQSHPFGPRRIKAMVEYYNSKEFREIWDKYSIPETTEER